MPSVPPSAPPVADAPPPARRLRSATVSRMSQSAEISIGVAPTIAIPLIATGRTNALPATITPVPSRALAAKEAAAVLSTGAYHFNRRRPKHASHVPAPELTARGTESFPPPTPLPDDDPVPADIEVRAADGEVRLQVGNLAIRCSNATATWIAQALLEAARAATTHK